MQNKTDQTNQINLHKKKTTLKAVQKKSGKETKTNGQLPGFN